MTPEHIGGLSIAVFFTAVLNVRDVQIQMWQGTPIRVNMLFHFQQDELTVISAHTAMHFC